MGSSQSPVKISVVFVYNGPKYFIFQFHNTSFPNPHLNVAELAFPPIYAVSFLNSSFNSKEPPPFDLETPILDGPLKFACSSGMIPS